MAVTTGIRAIEVVGPGTYELALAGEPPGRRVRCTVVERGGVRAVQPEPDVFITGELPARPVAAAVLAFHDAVMSTGAPAEGSR
jgi:hypothetical protein